MMLPIDTSRRRADAYRRRAIELAQEARWENDKGRRRFLLDKARSAVAAADEIARAAAGAASFPQVMMPTPGGRYRPSLIARRPGDATPLFPRKFFVDILGP
jgi:hypothetical protein